MTATPAHFPGNCPGNCPAYVFQEDLFRKIATLGLNVEKKEELFFGVDDTHRSKSKQLPIIKAAAPSKSKVFIHNLSYNFYFYVLSVSFSQGIPAVFMRPISDHLGNIPLSGHVREKDWMITNFEKAYQNIDRLNHAMFMVSNPLQAVTVLRYLDYVQRLPINEILDDLFYKTSYGSIDRINFNAVRNTDDLISKCGLQVDHSYGKHKFTDKLSGLYTEMMIDIYDTTVGNSSLHFATKDPLLPINPGGTLMVPVTGAQVEAGIGSAQYLRERHRIPVKFLQPIGSSNDPEWHEKCEMGPRLHGAYFGPLSLSALQFTVNYNNAFDTIMGAVMLNECLPQAVDILQ